MSSKRSKWTKRGKRIQLPDVETETQLELPKSEKVVVKTVPAKADGEVIGTAVIYEDGTMDIVTSDDISDTARAHVKDFKLFMAGED